MNPREALRFADPAKQLPVRQIDDRDEELLRQILATPTARAGQTAGAAREPQRRRPAARDRKPLFATVIVAVIVVVGAVIAIRPVPTIHTDPAIAPSPTSNTDADLEAALFARLTNAASDQASLRGQPAMTWTEQGQSPTGGPIDTTGKTQLMAAACTNGGAIAIQVTGRADVHLDCTHLSAVGPINLTEAVATAAKGVGVDVMATSGHPRYIAKFIAITDPAPTAKRCAGIDLTASSTRMAGAMGTDYGDIAITNHASSACTLLGYPTAYLTARAGGTSIGGPVKQLYWNSTSEQSPTKPTTVTLPADGGKAYLRVSIVDIAGYSTSDGTYYKTCGQAVTGRGWVIRLPGTSEKIFAAFTPETRELCSNPEVSISSISQVLSTPTTHE